MYQKIYNSSPYFFKCCMASVKGHLNNKKRYNEFYKHSYEQLIANLDVSYTEILLYQEKKLKELLTECYQYSEYYAEEFKKINCNINTIEADPYSVLEKMPILTKAIRKNKVEEILNKNPLRKTVSIGHTSGTTGTPTKNYSDAETSAYSVALWERFHKMIGINRSDKHITFSSNIVSIPRKKSKPFWVYNCSSNQLLMSVFHLKDEFLIDYVEKINKFKPKYIDGFPSAIAIIAKYINNNKIKLTFTPKLICTTAETLFDDQRIEIEKAFNCKVYNQYASSEGSPFITECKFGNMHLHEDSGYFEILNDNNQNIINNPDGLGRMVVTSLRNWKTPLIRYDILDFVQLTDNTNKCKCGSNFKYVKNVLGRANDMLWTYERGYVSGGIASAIKNIKGIEKLQIIQIDPENIIIKIKKDDYYELVYEKLITNNLKDRLGENIKFQFNYNLEINHNKTGKLKLLIREFEVSDFLNKI